MTFRAKKKSFFKFAFLGLLTLTGVSGLALAEARGLAMMGLPWGLVGPVRAAPAAGKAPLTPNKTSTAPAVVAPAAQMVDLPSEVLNKVKPPSLKDLRGAKLVLVNFWATWCGPCKESLPFYEKLYQKYSKQGLKILAFSADESAQAARDFVLKNPVSFPVYFDEGRRQVEHFQIEAVPTLLVLDKELKVLEVFRGYTPGKLQDLEKRIVRDLEK